ncbi:MAG: HDOD domain-containing protein [Nitrospinae bacterium]|nr:HDOD domain-containing protein [Nitrospinota bacterium]
MEILDLITENEPLASLPNSYYLLQEAMEDPNSDFVQIGKIISVDPALTVRLLQIVNSAFYGYHNKIETVTHALGVVGTEQLMQLVLATSVVGQFKGIPADMINMEYFWKHSVACGLVARAIHEINNDDDGERYFVAGLLHDIGKLVMCLKIPDQFRIAMDFARKSGDRWYKAEAKYFGFDHGGVGGALLRAWNLPERLQESVAHHHNPVAAKNYAHEAAVIFLADHISHEIIDSPDGENPRCEVKPSVWQILHLQEGIHKSIIKEKVFLQLEEVTQVFLQTS